MLTMGTTFRSTMLPQATLKRTAHPCCPTAASLPKQDQPLVAIMNQAAARDCFGNENPIGKHLTLSHITLTKGEITYEVVGVVENAKYNDIQQSSPPTIYRDLSQQSFAGSQLAVRT